MKKSLSAAAHGADITGEVFSPELAPGEILLGTLMAIDSNGQPQVNFEGMDAASAMVALSTVPVAKQHIGRQVALLFASGDFRKPIIMGIIHSPLNDLLESFSMQQALNASGDEDPFDGEPMVVSEKSSPLETVHVDGKRVVIEGQEEIVLSCGESSITLTKAGKILIRGKYLLSRSSGVNRILGGSVQVN